MSAVQLKVLVACLVAAGVAVLNQLGQGQLAQTLAMVGASLLGALGLHSAGVSIGNGLAGQTPAAPAPTPIGAAALKAVGK